MGKSKSVKGRSLTVPTSRRNAVTEGKSRCDPEKRQLYVDFLRGGGKKLNFHKLLFAILIFLLPTQLGKHFWPQWTYVLGLRVDYLSPTIYLTDLLVLGILLSWIWESLKTPPRWSASWRTLLGGGISKKNWWVLAVFLFLLINCFFAQNQAAAFCKFIKIIEFTLLSFYITKNHSLLITDYSITFSIPVIYSSLIAIVQFVKQASLNGVFYWLGERTFDVSTPGIAKAIIGGRLVMRPYATFPHPNVLAGFVLVSLILIVIRNTQYPPKAKTFRRTGAIRKIKPQNTSKKILWWLAVVLGILAILISFSRSAWLVGLAVGLWWLKSHFKTPPRWANALLGGGAKRILLATCYLLLVTGLALLLLFFLPFSTSEALSQRLQLAKAAISLIKKSPLVGVGLNNFIVRLPEFWQTPEAIRFLQPVHNIYLLTAAEIGLVGLLVFGWFLILTYKKLLNCFFVKLLDKRKKNFCDLPITNYSLLITALSSILLLGLFDHYFLTLQQTQLLLTIVLGLSWGDRSVKI